MSPLVIPTKKDHSLKAMLTDNGLTTIDVSEILNQPDGRQKLINELRSGVWYRWDDHRPVMHVLDSDVPKVDVALNRLGQTIIIHKKQWFKLKRRQGTRKRCRAVVLLFPLLIMLGLVGEVLYLMPDKAPTKTRSKVAKSC